MGDDVEVTVLNRQRRRKIGTRALCGFLRRLTRLMPGEGAREVTACLVSDRRMRQLNRDFRGLDRTTDVLSFPGDVGPDGRRHLGDIVISVEAAGEQARARGHGLRREIEILLVHGYLHLLGFDHDGDGGRMRRTQARLLGALTGSRRRGTR